MTCLADTAPLPMATSGISGAALRFRFKSWWRQKFDRRDTRYLVALNDRELHDLGLHRDWFSPERPPELGTLWLHRTAS